MKQLLVRNLDAETVRKLKARAQVHGLTVATRNAGDFEKTGVDVVDPWEDR